MVSAFPHLHYISEVFFAADVMELNHWLFWQSLLA